jgi:hypothetical protein
LLVRAFAAAPRKFAKGSTISEPALGQHRRGAARAYESQRDYFAGRYPDGSPARYPDGTQCWVAGCLS